jgi:hypothetical protein
MSHYCAKLRYIYDFVKWVDPGLVAEVKVPVGGRSLAEYPFTTITVKISTAIWILIKLYTNAF